MIIKNISFATEKRSDGQRRQCAAIAFWGAVPGGLGVAALSTPRSPFSSCGDANRVDSGMSVLPMCFRVWPCLAMVPAYSPDRGVEVAYSRARASNSPTRFPKPGGFHRNARWLHALTCGSFIRSRRLQGSVVVAESAPGATELGSRHTKLETQGARQTHHVALRAAISNETVALLGKFPTTSGSKSFLGPPGRGAWGSRSCRHSRAARFRG